MLLFGADRQGEQLARPRDVGGAGATGQQSVVPDAVEAPGQHVHQEASDEPENPRYHAFAGTAYLREKDYHLAAVYLRRSVDLFPEQPLMLYNLAVALCFDGEEEAGIEELAKAVRIDEGYARAWYLKAKVEADLGREADAAVSAGRAVANGSALSAQELEGVRALLGQLSGHTTHGPRGV